MKNYVQKGENLTLIAPRALKSGDGFMVGSIFAVASADAAQGAPVVGVTEDVFDLPKATGAVTPGAKAYWDNTAFNLTTNASGTTLVGVFTQAAASADPSARVKLGIVA